MTRFLKFGAPHYSHGSIVKVNGAPHRMALASSGTGGSDNGLVIALQSPGPASAETIFLSMGRYPTREEAEKEANTQFPIRDDLEGTTEREQAIRAIVEQLNAEVILGNVDPTAGR